MSGVFVDRAVISRVVCIQLDDTAEADGFKLVLTRNPADPMLVVELSGEAGQRWASGEPDWPNASPSDDERDQTSAMQYVVEFVRRHDFELRSVFRHHGSAIATKDKEATIDRKEW